MKTLAVDATADTAPDEVFAALEPDVLVICAGALAPAAPVQELSWEAFSANWETDVKASFLFCRAALRGRLKPGSRIVLISSGAALSGGPPFAGGYAGAKRMQMFMAGHCQKELDRLGLGLRFMALAPMRIMPGTGVGDGGIDGYAAYSGIQPADFLAGMTDMQTPAEVGRAVVALATGKSQGSCLHGERERTGAGRLRRAECKPNSALEAPYDRRSWPPRAIGPARPADPRSAGLRAFHGGPPPGAQAPLLPDDGLAARGGRPRPGHLSAGLAREVGIRRTTARFAVGSTRSPPTAASTPSRPGRGRIAFFSSPDGRPPTGRPQAGLQPRSPGWSLTRTRSLPGLVDGEPGPEARYETREAVQLAFVAAIQVLPPRQRAALLLSDVLGWSAVETARLLGGSTASINSALQRARATLAARYPQGRPMRRSQPNPEEGLLLERYMQAWQAANLDGLIELLREDATYRMPPWREWYQGRAGDPGFLRDRLAQICGLPHGGHRGQRPARGRGLRAHPSGPCVASPFPACDRARRRWNRLPDGLSGAARPQAVSGLRPAAPFVILGLLTRGPMP